jgi:FeS assembly SUF system protein
MMSKDLRAQVVDALKTVYDPEIPVNIYELGLVYGLDVSPGGDVVVKMTLTAPNCPVAEILPAQVKQRILAVKGVKSVTIDLVFDPPWDRSKMSDAAKLALGFDLDPGMVPLSRLQP